MVCFSIRFLTVATRFKLELFGGICILITSYTYWSVAVLSILSAAIKIRILSSKLSCKNTHHLSHKFIFGGQLLLLILMQEKGTKKPFGNQSMQSF